jgi:hypothetical protein
MDSATSHTTPPARQSTRANRGVRRSLESLEDKGWPRKLDGGAVLWADGRFHPIKRAEAMTARHQVVYNVAWADGLTSPEYVPKGSLDDWYLPRSAESAAANCRRRRVAPHRRKAHVAEARSFGTELPNGTRAASTANILTNAASRRKCGRPTKSATADAASPAGQPPVVSPKQPSHATRNAPSSADCRKDAVSRKRLDAPSTADASGKHAPPIEHPYLALARWRRAAMVAGRYRGPNLDDPIDDADDDAEWRPADDAGDSAWSGEDDAERSDAKDDADGNSLPFDRSTWPCKKNCIIAAAREAAPKGAWLCGLSAADVASIRRRAAPKWVEHTVSYPTRWASAPMRVGVGHQAPMAPNPEARSGTGSALCDAARVERLSGAQGVVRRRAATVRRPLPPGSTLWMPPAVGLRSGLGRGGWVQARVAADVAAPNVAAQAAADGMEDRAIPGSVVVEPLAGAVRADEAAGGKTGPRCAWRIDARFDRWAAELVDACVHERSAADARADAAPERTHGCKRPYAVLSADDEALFDEAMKSYGHADDAQGSVVYDGGDFCAVRRAMAAKGSLVTTGEVVNFFYLTRKFSAKNRRGPEKVGARGRRSGAKRRRVSR